MNSLPTQVFSGKSPFECFQGHAPCLDHIRTMGCLCYATIPNFSDKFSPKSIPAIFMVYSSTQKGYRLINIETNTFFINRDVIFKEHIFPFGYSKPFFLKYLCTASDDDNVPSLLTSHVMPSDLDFSFPVDILLPGSSSSISYLVSSPLIPSSSPVPSSSSLLHPVSPATIVVSSPVVPLPSSSFFLPLSRKSTRHSKPPIWLTDYVHPPLSSSNYCLYPID